MDKQISIAVIGAGYWGKNLVRNFHQLGVLKIICDQDKKTLAQMAKDYGDVTTTSDMEAVFDNPAIDAIVLATPAATHSELAEKALNAGKHVFVEKPLAMTYEEGKKLVDLTGEKGKILFVGHILQYHPAIVELKEIVRQGRVGRLQYIYSRRLSLGKIRREENILWSFAPHDISVILSIVGEEPHYINSVGSNFLHARIADVTMTNLKFPSGIGAHIFVSWLNPFKEQRLVVVASEGMLVFDDTQPLEQKLILYPHTINWKNGVPVAEKAQSEAIDLSGAWEEPLKAECKAFLASVATGRPPLTSGEEALRVLKILDISQRSLDQNDQNVQNDQNIPLTDVSVANIASPISTDYFCHESAIIDKEVEIGKGTKIWQFSHLLSGSKIGENCNIGQNVVIGPEAIVGNKCKIQNNVSVYKGVTLEDGVFCGPSMVFTNVFNPRAEISKMDELRPTLVQRGATIGANATIVCGVTIGRYAFIGAGAVVTRDVSPYALFVGNPARQAGWMCQCGERLSPKLLCSSCKRQYVLGKGEISES